MPLRPLLSLVACLAAVAALTPALGAAQDAEPPGRVELVGAIHEQTGYSDGTPQTRPADAFARGRQQGNDFMAVTEHAESLLFPGTVSEDCFPVVAQCLISDTNDLANNVSKWAAIAEQAGEAGTASFTGLRGFEWTSDRLGHINVLFSQNFKQAYVGTDNVDMTEFWSWFTRSPALGGGSDGLGVFNHPGAKDLSPADPQRNWNDFAYVPAADRRMVGIEVFNRGSELGSRGENGGYYARALDRGWHVGAVGAEDSHDSRWGEADRPKTVVMARDGSAEAIREALLARRFYAVSTSDRRLTFTVDGAPMGARLRRSAGEALTVAARVSGPAGEAHTLELVTSGGEVVATGDDALAAERPASAEEPWYFVRAKDAGGRIVAYSSPVWVESSAPGRTWLAGDLHVHSCFSPEPYCAEVDGPPGEDTEPRPGATVKQRFEQAGQRGLDFLAITDHNDVRSAQAEGFGGSGVIGIPGYESSLNGHAQVLGSDQLLDNGDKGVEAISRQASALRAAGGAFQANHPAYKIEDDFTCADVDTDRSPLHWSYGTRVGLDTVEAFNPTSSTFYAGRFLDCLLAAGQTPAATGGSDTHDLALSYGVGPGNPTTWVLSADRSRAGVLAALRDGRTTITANAPGAAGEGARPLLLEADGDGDGTFESVVGDSVPPRSRMRARSDDPSATGFLRIVAGGVTVAEPEMVAGQPVEFDAPEDGGYVRVTLNRQREDAVERPDCRPGSYFAISTCSYDRSMLAMTSPMYVAAPEQPGGGEGPGGDDGGQAGQDDGGRPGQDDGGRPGDQGGEPAPGRDPRPGGPSAASSGGASSLGGPRRGLDGPRVFPSKLQVRRAQVRNGRLDVLAMITGRASGRVRVAFQAAGRTVRFTAPVVPERRYVRFVRRLPRAQARLGTGILSLGYGGDADTLPRTVRTRAARNRAGLTAQRPVARDGRLVVSGTVAGSAPGTVRILLVYVDDDGTRREHTIKARIRDGRWQVTGAALPPAARREAYASIQYTGNYERRIRGEMRAMAVGR